MKTDETKQVKMVKETHQRVKIFSVTKGRTFYEVVDTACNQYLDGLKQKEVASKERK